jgi:predicted permease
LLVILGLGLSAGALLALVSLFNALFWRELPVAHPDELVAVAGVDPRHADEWRPGVPAGLFTSLESAQTVFQTLAGFEPEPALSIAVVKGSSQRLTIDAVSGRYFEALDLHPTLGRLIGPRDVDGEAAVAAISFRCWQAHFGGDPGVIGETFRLKGELVMVIGVAPPAFTGLELGAPTDAWVTASLAAHLIDESPTLTFFTTFGRLRPGVTLEQARTQISSLWPHARDAAATEIDASLKQWYDHTRALQPRLESAARGFSDAGYRTWYQRPLTLLILLSAITVLLCCANLSGLLLARWSAREHDLAVQAALGASNGRLISQVIGESMALSVLAVGLSVPLALWSAQAVTILLWNQPDVSSPLALSPDYRVWAVMGGLMSLVALGVSLLPAARIGSAKLTLTGGARGFPGRRVTRWGRWLAAAQVALSVPLLVSAWTVAINLHRLEGANTGFQPDGVTVSVLVNQRGSTATAVPDGYFLQLTSAVFASPGVSTAALSSREPGSFGADWRRRSVTGDEGVRAARPFPVAVSPGYFASLNVRLVAGRDFSWRDDHGRPDVAIMSEGLATALFPGADPLGRRIRLSGPPDRLLDVIGVVADAKLAEPHTMNQLFVFTALLQESPQYLALGSPYLLLKSPLPPPVIEAQARRAIVPLGRHDIIEAHSLRHTLDGALVRERIMRLGASYFAGLTTLLVFIGLYAVLNLDVMRRIPEIGLRLALGASPHDIRMTVIRDALRTAATGLVIGLPLAFATSRLIASSVTMVGSHDLTAFAVAVALTLTTAALSVLMPVRRASRISPMRALTT